LAQTIEKLGAGEILLNCIDKDGTNSGFDIELVKHIRNNVSIPVISSSGTVKVEHFSEVFEKIKAEAALAEGTFYREEVPFEAVKDHMREE
jgi:glutamine amidotransferase/cyclase